MQTFLPFESFEDSARVLSHDDLRRSREHTVRIIVVLEKWRSYDNYASFHPSAHQHDRFKPSDPWAEDPFVQMWRGHEGVLVQYGVAMCYEWRRVRGEDCMIHATLLNKLDSYRKQESRKESFNEPWWLGDEKLHGSHRYNLHRRDPKHYADFRGELGYTCCLTCDWYWPNHIHR